MAAETQAPPTLGQIAHFEIGAQDGKKLSAFYSGVFGWKFGGAPGMEDYLMAELPGGSAVAVYTAEEKRTTNYIGVDNVKTYVEKIKANGGTIAHEFTVANFGYGAIGIDPEGNFIGVWQADRTAHE